MEIKATELRIGNYYKPEILDDVLYDVITVEDISDLFYDPIDDYYSPIPLTEEWLLRFGFYKDTNYYTNHLIETSFMFKRTMIHQSGEVNVKYLEYVHQLQNLYFALTGEELTIK
jgi:hypothetical protein